MGYDVREFVATPNPNALKVVLDRVISDRPLSFFNAESGAAHPLARQLFAVAGVNGLLMLDDFITVSKTPESGWKTIRPAVQRILRAYVDDVDER